MSRQAHFVKILAQTLLTNNWHEAAMTARLYWLLDDRPTWVAPLVRRVLSDFIKTETATDPKRLAHFISHDPGFEKVWIQHRQSLLIRHYWLKPLPPQSALIACEQTLFDSVKHVANWLGLSWGQLENYSHHWHTDTAIDDQRHQHYHYQWRNQKGNRKRLIEAPKQRMAAAQRQIYLGVLDKIPLHEACHGFRRGHSRQTFVSPHTGKPVIIKIDLRNFFTGIPIRRIHALFTALGYSNSVAQKLAGLCCNQTPDSVIRHNQQLNGRQRQQLRTPHLPQGSPSSPALANLSAFGLDCRLKALAEKFGADYTRYADDLAFSGDHTLACNAEHLTLWVATIASDEGFSVNHRKTRVMRQGVSQRLTGITVNQFANSSRKGYEQLKAILHNCVKYGPETQNRKQHRNFKAHLQGRIAEIRSLNPNRAHKLEQVFQQIRWKS